MALLVLILIGIVFGWLASILARTESVRDVGIKVGLAIAASLAAGLIINQSSMLGGISPLALGLACSAAGMVLVIYHAISARSVDDA